MDNKYNSKLEGNCYTRELRYPIKVYKIFKNRSFEIKFPEGVEIRKIIVGTVVSVFIALIYLLILIYGSMTLKKIIINQGIILLFLTIVIVMLISFWIDYGNKSVYRFYKDLFLFYRNKSQEFEHYELVDRKNMSRGIKYTEFITNDERSDESV